MTETAKQIIEIPGDEEISKSFLEYSMSVVYSRAIPDALDGLKPVQRRILYSMQVDGFTHDKNYVKSARPVASCMGTYHPHGDSSIYEALVKMAQDFYLNVPMVDGYGNFGDITGSGAAASRYCVTGDTHVRLADGSSVRIDKLVDMPDDSEKDIDIQVLDRNGEMVNAVKAFNSGVHDIKRVTIANGQTIAGSYNHPLLVMVSNTFGVVEFGWKTLEELEIGNIVCVYRDIRSLEVTNSLDTVFQPLATVPFNQVAGLVLQAEKQGYIPEEVWESGRETKRAFLKAILEENKKLGVYNYTSFERKLVQGLQEILLELGTVSTIWHTETDGMPKSFLVTKTSGITKYAYFPVTSVEDETPQQVYSIKVDTEDHSFLAGGFINHNTEARLSKAAQFVLQDVKEETVDMRPNYDGETMEPVVLPSRFPLLLVNGNFGIGVGFASKFAPHNPGEAIDATKFLVKNPDATLKQVMKYIPGPDFPTGSQILGADGILEAYETGQGVIRLRATSEIKPVGRGRHQIIFTDLPYGVKSEIIIKKVKDSLKAGKLQGLADAKDLTDRKNGLRLVIDTKTGVNPKVLLAELYKETPLEDSFGINNTALVDGEPKVIGLIEMIQIFIRHRDSVIVRRSDYRKNKRETRLHLVEGLLKALTSIDEVIRIVRGSVDATAAQEGLIKKFKIDDTQADYILSIALRRLTKYDQIELKTEQKKLKEEIKELTDLIKKPELRRTLILSELDEAKKAVNHDRRSVIVDGSLAEHLEATKDVIVNSEKEVADEPCFLYFTDKGGIVRTDKEKNVPGLHSVVASTNRGRFIAVTNKGRGFKLETIHVGTRTASVTTVLPEKLGKGEKVLAITPLELAEGKVGGIALGTKNGVVKIVSPSWPVRADEFVVMGLTDGDEIVDAYWVDDTASYDLVFITTDSSLLTYPADKVRPQGLTGGGMAGVRVADGCTVLSFNVVPSGAKEKAMVVTVSNTNRGKQTPFLLYPSKGRGTGGVRSQALLKGETELLYATVGAKPVLYDSNGIQVALPERIDKRDASGKPLDDGTLM
jgi:DNA gyrase/topoisomerase IV subunit A